MKSPRWLSRENIEWLARLYVFLRRRPLTAYGGLLVIGAIALYSNVFQLIIAGIFFMLGKPQPISDPPQGAYYAALAAGCLLIVLDRLLPEKSIFPNAYPHDEALMRKIRDTYTAELDRFLRTWAFGNGSFEYKILNPIYDFREWRGSAHDFINSEVNEAWKKVREAGHTLANEIGEKTISARNSLDRITPFRDDEDPDWHSDDVVVRCSVLDDAADKFVEEWDKFDAIGRRQIPNIVC